MKNKLLCLYLDLLALPGIFMTKKTNASLHLKYICPRCPDWRKKMREMDKGCFWLNSWKEGNYKIPKSFGFKNKIHQYLFSKSNLSKFKNKKNESNSRSP